MTFGRSARTFAIAVFVPVLFGEVAVLLTAYVAQIFALALFYGIPLAIGWFAAATLRIRGRATLGACFGAAFVAGSILAAILFGLEDAILVPLAYPLPALFVALGAWLGWIFVHDRYRADAARDLCHDGL